MRFFTSLALIGSFLLCGSYGEEKPNFIVILTDDQSWVGTSLQIDPKDPRSKSDYYQTPNLERLASIGVSFTDGYAPAPFCCPTRRSLLIGQTPARHLYQKDQKSWPAKYRKQLSIPRMLKAVDAHYVTAHFGKWDSRFDGVLPEEMGYDVSDGKTGNDTGGGKGSGGPAVAADPKLIGGITSRAITFMENQVSAERPFYVQLSHYAVHLDIFYSKGAMARAKARPPGTKHTMAEFAAMTDDVDRAVGEVLDKVESLGIKESTYVFFLSDNGGREAIPMAPEAKLPLNHPLRDGKGSVYEGGIRVPFVVVGPGVKQGSLSRVPVTGLDILPTLADLADYRSPLPDSLDGGSLRSVLRGGDTVTRARPFLIFHQAVARKAQSAIREGDFKLVKHWKQKQVELFDLSQDRSEARNLSQKMPDVREDLERKLDGFLSKVGAETRKTMSKKNKASASP
ncbi:MAG: sulfatase-like hydrolase/transferase [Verrucomicrobiales bacterium]|nr:sulfatase-like hydrolase/transferase [Verrucomicrobiales bacterium]